MEMLLTSFGLSHLTLRPKWRQRLSAGGYYRDAAQFFNRMPPVSMARIESEFSPDYSTLLLCDRLVMDGESFDRLANRRHSSNYRAVAQLVTALRDEGFLRLEDFETVIGENRALLVEMTKRDLSHPRDWLPPFEKSMVLWSRFVGHVPTLLGQNGPVDAIAGDPTLMHEEVRASSTQAAFLWHMIPPPVDYTSPYRHLTWPEIARRESRYATGVLKGYLSYVNANLVLAHELGGIAFHDWQDFEPFYRQKFLSIGMRSRPGYRETAKVAQLFDVALPGLVSWDTSKFMKAITDKRIVELRELVDAAIEQRIEFDHDFASRVLREVVAIEQKLDRVRRIVSYATLPLGLIPLLGGPVDRAISETASAIATRKARKPLRWLYMITSLDSN